MGERASDEEVARLHQEVEHLYVALASRDVIGQAKGILMERHGVDAEEAFARLVRISQVSNTKLRDVAITVTGASSAGDGHHDGEGPRSRGAADRQGAAETGVD